MTGAIGMGLAQRGFDSQGPPVDAECSHCEGSRELEAITVGDVKGDVEDWPSELERPAVPCFYCLPEYRGGDDDAR